MKTPAHWQSKNLLARLLYLPSCLYALATWCRIKFNKPQKIGIPVICIGNLTAGGSGKTPTAVSIARLLKQAGRNPFFVSRGYGGKLKNLLVNPQRHKPEDVGDEPLLLAREAPVAINADRYLAAKLAAANGADIIIMDDGFQNPSLHKDLSFLVIDGAYGLGNTYPVPAGPMREFLCFGRRRADAVILLGEDKCGIRNLFKGLPVFEGKVVPVKPANPRPAIAFAGIGRPQKFYQSLEQCGVKVIKTHDFPDHHFYSRNELELLIAEAAEAGAALFTTAKDMVKIPEDLQPEFNVLEITVNWQDEAALARFCTSLFTSGLSA